MTRADHQFIQDCQYIMASPYSDNGLPVRPKWPDGTPAHTTKRFTLINRFQLDEELPILTLRKINWKLALKEIFWIYQKATSEIAALGGHIWDAWDVGDGTIGKAYGYQIGIKTKYPEGEFNQMEKVLYDLEHNPTSRSIQTNTYNHQDLPEMGLRPCAYGMNYNTYWDAARGKFILNAVLIQRSQDYLAANNWNILQYSLLLMLVAKCVNMEPGEIVHVIIDAHIYDRHVPIIQDMVDRYNAGGNEFAAPRVIIIENEDFIKATSAIERWYALRPDDVVLVDYKHDDVSYKFEIAE